MSEYKLYSEVTKEVLNSIKVGDLVKINDWEKPMRVRGVSDNYFVMTQKQFKETIYSVCEKKVLEPETYIHNRMIGGNFHCSTDDRTFGFIPEHFDMENGKQYDFDNYNWVKEYLNAFETGKIELSERHGIAIHSILIKHST